MQGQLWHYCDTSSLIGKDIPLVCQINVTLDSDVTSGFCLHSLAFSEHL